MHINDVLSGGIAHALIFWTACTIWIAPELVAAMYRRSPRSSALKDKGSLHLIAWLWWIGIFADAFVSHAWPQTSFTGGRNALFLAGIALMFAGTAFRWYSARMLGKYFTFDVSIQSGHALVQRGPYRYVRHPSYTGALLSLAGFGLALGNWVGLIVGLGCLASAYAYRIPLEESALLASLGDPYSQYLKRTWRLVPFLL